MRILLIEDDSALAQTIDLMLRADSVFITGIGEAGLKLATQYEYDIVILDLSLPDVSGYEVLRTLRLSALTASRVRLRL